MDNASEALFALKPVTFRYRQEIDPSHKLSFDLIAEDVAKITADLVSLGEEGKPQNVRYEAVNAMLLNEFLKEHRKNEEQEATIAQQQKEINALKAELKDQAAQIQKVSVQLEVSKSAPQMVLNNLPSFAQHSLKSPLCSCISITIALRTFHGSGEIFSGRRKIPRLFLFGSV